MASRKLRSLLESYVWSTASAAVADKQLHEIDRACFVLGAWPEYGRARDDVRLGIRCVSVSRYVVFYRVTMKSIEIVRVLDERRDVDAIFSEVFHRPCRPATDETLGRLDWSRVVGMEVAR
jgi:toxin ParE1/3/4